jgi:hypothetical protein
MRRLFIAGIMPLIWSVSASAQEAPSAKIANPSDVQAPEKNKPQYEERQSILEGVKESLEQAGLTDIKLLPNSFLVQAKDADDNPVVIVVGPDSISAVSVVPPGQTQRQPSTNGVGPEEVD